MTANPLLGSDGRFAVRDPVIAITARIERAPERLRLERAMPTTYPVYQEGRLIGSIQAPRGEPVFGRAAPTVLLRRER